MVMRNFVIAELLFAVLVIAGCADATPPQASKVEPVSEQLPSSSADSGKPQHEFFRDVPFTTVTKKLPDGSVDHIHLGAVAEPYVVVVVTVHEPMRPDLQFTTTFSGSTVQPMPTLWQPAKGSTDSEHIGVFVLPPTIESAATIVN